jgi:hypothetical protein
VELSGGLEEAVEGLRDAMLLYALWAARAPVRPHTTDVPGFSDAQVSAGAV